MSKNINLNWTSTTSIWISLLLDILKTAGKVSAIFVCCQSQISIIQTELFIPSLSTLANFLYFMLGFHIWNIIKTKKYVEELVDESDATSADGDTDDEKSEEEYESHHTDVEEDDEEIVTNEILRVANAIEEEDEEVLVAVVVDDGKDACDKCGKRYKVNGLNTHKAVHKKILGISAPFLIKWSYLG